MNKIITLGTFDIIINGESIMDKIGDQKRLIRLFKYFLIHNNTRLLSDKIIDDLYGSEDSKDPLNMLRGQIFRLRKAINENDLNIQPFFRIEYINGSYIFKLSENIKVDFIKFEEMLGKDTLKVKEAIKKDHVEFRETLLLYKGDFLCELADYWVIPTRIRFDRLYSRGLLLYMEYLKSEGLDVERVEIGEEALQIKPYNESISLNFMEALVELGQKEYALMYYEFFTRKIYEEFGASPSKEIIQFYKNIKLEKTDVNTHINIHTIKQEVATEFDSENVNFCNYENFKIIYNKELLNKERMDSNVALSIITLESKNYDELTDEELFQGMKILKSLFYRYLQPVDIVSKWNEKQILLLLHDIEKINIKNLVRDIHQVFDSKHADNNIRLNIKISDI